mgnify:CR=1 FL=1
MSAHGWGPDLTLLKKSLEEADVSSLYLDRTIDRMLVELMDFQNPFRQMLRRQPGSGSSYMVRTRTPGSTPGTDVDDTDTFTEDTGTQADVNFPYKTMGTQGKISRRVQKTGRLITDLLAEEIEAKAREMRDFEELREFWGNAFTTNSKQILGLHYHMVNHTGQIVALTNTGTGVDLTLAKFDQAMDLVVTGSPSVILTSRTGRRKINALLQSGQRFNDRTEVPGGFKVLSYNEVPILVSTNIPDTLNITSGGTVSSLTGGSTTAMFIVDLNQVFMSVLTELQVLPLARRSSQFEEFDIFEDCAMVARDYRGISMISGWKALG